MRKQMHLGALYSVLAIMGLLGGDLIQPLIKLAKSNTLKN